MVCARAPAPARASAIDNRLSCRIFSSSENPRSKLPPTGTGNVVNIFSNGAPLNFLKSELRLKLKSNSSIRSSSAINLIDWGKLSIYVERVVTDRPNVAGIFRALLECSELRRNVSNPTILFWILPDSSRLREIWNFNWFRFFTIPWSWTSRMVSIYLVCLSFAAEAHDGPLYSSDYACENVQKFYAGMERLRGEALKKNLNSIISTHQSLSYKEVWDALKILDAADVDKPDASSEIVEIYSLRAVSKLLAGKPEGWNREHLWPRSYGLISGPSLTDLHNIRPADVNVNSSRGNKFYGECHVNTSICRKPATKESASDTETDKERWAPPMKVRGDIARAIMYMAVCYAVNQSGGGLNLHLSDSPSIANREMGMLSTLLKWNEVDPPSKEEQLRNERICIKYQHNRNPFVDHPEYANRIWKHVVRRH